MNHEGRNEKGKYFTLKYHLSRNWFSVVSNANFGTEDFPILATNVDYVLK